MGGGGAMVYERCESNVLCCSTCSTALQDTSYTLSTMSGFSVNRMGSAFDLPSFLADLNTNQTISKTVYTPLANWNANAGYGTFTTGFSFDEPSGKEIAPSQAFHSS